MYIMSVANVLGMLMVLVWLIAVTGMSVMLRLMSIVGVCVVYIVVVDSVRGKEMFIVRSVCVVIVIAVDVNNVVVVVVGASEGGKHGILMVTLYGFLVLRSSYSF
jgi:hypothetical protein